MIRTVRGRLQCHEAKKAMAVPDSFLDVFTALICTQLQIRYEKLSEQERTVLKNVMKKHRHIKIRR